MKLLLFDTAAPAAGRDQVLAVRLSFQGLTVDTPSFGRLPWFEVIAWLDDPRDRQAAYQAKRAAGDTHAIVDLSGAYLEPGQPYAQMPGKDFTTDLPSFRARVEECLEEGFLVDVRLAGDGQSNPAGGYNDPVGKTYGHQWLMANLSRVVDALDGVHDSVIFCPGYDGVFYGWTPDQVNAFGQRFRSLLPNGYLALEFSAGVTHLGNGAADYGPGGALQAFDLFYGDFFGWLPNGTAGDQVWQVVARMIGPAYRRPPDQPAQDDPSPPFYLRAGTPRGPYVYNALEFDAFRWVRSQVTADIVRQERAYFQSIGCRYTG